MEMEGGVRSSFSVVELPDDCLVAILGRTTPWDTARLAGVCSTFRRVAESDELWLKFLPSDYRSVCGAGGNTREIVKKLAAGVFLDDGMQKYRLLQRSRGVCRKLSVAAMDVAWGSDMRFWKWERSRSSCFGKVAHLLAICWLEVQGTWRCTLPPGVYTAVWRLRVANPQGGRFYFLSWQKPLSFTVATADKQEMERTLDLTQAHGKTFDGKTFEDWVEFEVGSFTVPGEGFAAQPVEITYAVRETDCTYWKGGLYLDSLTLRPKGCEDDVPPYLKDRDFTKTRRHPGVF